MHRPRWSASSRFDLTSASLVYFGIAFFRSFSFCLFQCKVAPTFIRHMPFQGTVKIRPGKQISMRTIGLCSYMRSSLPECEISRIPIAIWFVDSCIKLFFQIRKFPILNSFFFRVDQIGLLKIDARYCSRHQMRNQYDQKGYFAPLRLLEVTLQCDHHEYVTVFIFDSCFFPVSSSFCVF